MTVYPAEGEDQWGMLAFRRKGRWGKDCRVGKETFPVPWVIQAPPQMSPAGNRCPPSCSPGSPFHWRKSRCGAIAGGEEGRSFSITTAVAAVWTWTLEREVMWSPGRQLSRHEAWESGSTLPGWQALGLWQVTFHLTASFGLYRVEAARIP
jgi:hypothetical protein